MVGLLFPYVIMIATGVAALWRVAPYPALIFLAVMAGWYTTRAYLTYGQDKKVDAEKSAGRERSLTTLVFIGMVICPTIALATPLLDFASYQPITGQLWLGVIFAAIGTYLFWRSHADLGAFWSAHLELREGHQLVTSGIYAHMRHPMYSAILLITFAQLLILNNWLAGPAGLATFGLLYFVRISSEEAMMREKFGAAWDEYAAETNRLWPRFGA
ncbi:MAG: protein-S-isoprenylcysteine O-methyltransferase [Pseudomonadota bacterium]